MPPSPRRKRKVFISHSGKDAWVARQIAREISRCGATPFLDVEEIAVGSEFVEEILEFLGRLMNSWS